MPQYDIFQSTVLLCIGKGKMTPEECRNVASQMKRDKYPKSIVEKMLTCADMADVYFSIKQAIEEMRSLGFLDVQEEDV